MCYVDIVLLRCVSFCFSHVCVCFLFEFFCSCVRVAFMFCLACVFVFRVRLFSEILSADDTAVCVSLAVFVSFCFSCVCIFAFYLSPFVRACCVHVLFLCVCFRVHVSFLCVWLRVCNSFGVCACV